MQVQEYLKFTWAQTFRDENQQPYDHKKNWQEKLGDRIFSPVGTFLDYTLKEIKNPITIVALTVLAAFIVTLVYYPSVVFTALPFLQAVKPWMVKAAIYLNLQSFVLGWGIRAYGRFNNDELLEKWNNGELTAAIIGEKKI